MNRIAILSDIHGNLPAFEAVLNDVARRGIRDVVLAGDLVGRGPQGSAVVARAQELGLRSVRGNHEDYLLDFRKGKIPDTWNYTEEWACARWMANELTESSAQFIDAFPFSMTAGFDDSIRIVHGSPESYNEGIGNWLTGQEIEHHLNAVEESVLICAHTHRAAVWEFPHGLVVNVGSVGMPFNGDTRAQYAVLEYRGDRWHAEICRVHYAHEELLGVYESSGFLEAGGATSALLRYEIEYARPFLVPFLKWAAQLNRTPTFEYLEEFLKVQDLA
jgi:predicted phosphodiesterase